MAEPEIFADKNGFTMQIADENLLDKFAGGEPRELESEWQNHDSFEAERVEPLHALRVGREPQRGRLRVEHLSRRGIKREGCGDRTEGVGALDGGAKNRLMAQMDAIEVANGQHAGVAEGCIARGPGLRRRERREPGRPGAPCGGAR